MREQDPTERIIEEVAEWTPGSFDEHCDLEQLVPLSDEEVRALTKCAATKVLSLAVSGGVLWCYLA